MLRALATGVLALASVLALNGCFIELLGATAIQSGLQAEQAGTLTRTLDQVKDTKAETEFNHAVQAYRAEHGEYPPSIDAMIPNYLAQAPTKPDGTPYGYDPNTGQLLDGPAIQTLQTSDTQKLQQLQQAVTAYWQQTGGYYPPNLQSLVPTYIASVPKTNAGQDFVYDPGTATVYHPNPNQMNQSAPHGGQPRGRSPVSGGGGLMGETMTGIGIQQELNGMSNAGASAAGSRARSGAGDIRTQSNDRASDAMDDLGL